MQLEQKIIIALDKYGITNFISGMALGVDLDFAEIVLNLRKKYSITLECALPCPDQTLKWKEKDKLRYNTILKAANIINVVSERYTYECMFKRNCYMVDKSDLVIAVFNGLKKGGTWHTINYAEMQNKYIEFVELCNIN